MYHKSIEPLSKAIQMAPNEPCYYHERAKSFLLTDQFENSVNDFNKVIEF